MRQIVAGPVDGRLSTVNFAVGAPSSTRTFMIRLRIATAIVDVCALIGCGAFRAEELPLRRATVESA